ncbi:MAG: DNA gyrase inhibitor YacG [Alphaproteobacteria bacterium]|nr:DNA gyrase inhibitor YacG [Alphaproteobacteria bacterium]
MSSACPMCLKPAAQAFDPFCSRRCADVDLSRWLNGLYAIPGAAAEDEGDATPRLPAGDGLSDE